MSIRKSFAETTVLADRSQHAAWFRAYGKAMATLREDKYIKDDSDFYDILLLLRRVESNLEKNWQNDKNANEFYNLMREYHRKTDLESPVSKEEAETFRWEIATAAASCWPQPLPHKILFF